MSDLPLGLYERIITAQLKARLLKLDASRTTITKEPVDAAEAFTVLARHVQNAVSDALRSLPAQERLAKQAELANQLLLVLQNIDDAIETPAEMLLSIQEQSGIPGDDKPIIAPLVPLSNSDLLVNARGEPALAHALGHEIPSADSIDLLCAFVRWHGLRVLEDQLRAHRRLGNRCG